MVESYDINGCIVFSYGLVSQGRDISSFMKFLRFCFLALILTGIGIWLINVAWVQLCLPSQLNREIERCQKEHDLTRSIRILKAALAKYPEAPNRPAAERLLQTRQRQLNHTEQLVKIIDQAQNMPQLSNAVALLKNGTEKYCDATNQANARQILTDLQLRQADAERLVIATQYAQQSEDVTYGVKVLTQTLAESPNATNRQEAEALLAKHKKQQDIDEALAQAMTESQESTDLPGAIIKLQNALAATPQSQYRQQAEDMLNQLKVKNEPLATAIWKAREATDAADVSAGIPILQKALEQYPASPNQKEAQELLDEYQQQFKAVTADQQQDVANFLKQVSSITNRARNAVNE